MKRRIIFVIGWLFCSWIAAGAWTASFQHQFGRHSSIPVETCRESLANGWGWGLAGGPFSATASIFLTGFYENGFQWTCESKEQP
jgi:hypothetical protein